MNTLQTWEKDLAELSRLNEQFVLFVKMRGLAMPFNSEFVEVNKIGEYLARGFVYCTRSTVNMRHPDRYQIVAVPTELVNSYLQMDYVMVPNNADAQPKS